MTAEELGALHPRLYHVTFAASAELISRLGLLSTCELVRGTQFGADAKADLTSRRRSTRMVISHPLHGNVTLNDNAPLPEQALAKCLDDDLTPACWYRMLNSRVFFWVSKERVTDFLKAPANRGVGREVLVFNTMTLVQANFDRVEIAPINTGYAFRRPVRRGRATFSPLASVDYQKWRKARMKSKPDEIVEVIVRDHVRDAVHHLVDEERFA